MLSNMVFDRTANDVAQKTDKGFYRPTDITRVELAIETIRGRLEDDGYIPPPYIPLWGYFDNQIPRKKQMTEYLNSVRMLRGYIAMPEEYAIPVTMDGFTYIGANAIEKFLYQLDECIDNIEATWWYCDELYSDEVDM